MGEWQPIETAPKDAVLLVWNGDYISLGRYLARYDEWIDYISESETFADQPTHWMPLPEPPK